MFDNINHIHFIGIGGSGISAIAQWAKKSGKKISGSDKALNQLINNLKSEGIEVFIGHKKEQILDTVNMVIYSEAIDKKTNPEYLEALSRGLLTMSYFEALGKISEQKKTIVVTGTHGKTTTTAMLGQALIFAGLDSSIVVGSRVKAFGDSNLHVGKSEWLVVEGCEYRRSFLQLKPFGVILLNCELEHVDYYKNEEDYVSAFEELVSKIPKEGFFVFNQMDKNALKVSQKNKGKTMGVDMPLVKNLNLDLKVIGEFNQINATHAYIAALEMGINPEKIKKGLEEFSGTARRMEIKGEKNQVLVIDDYAHHPTEIRVTLKAMREKYPKKRIICVFQPHQFSRTYQMLKEFKDAFKNVDWVMIPNIYEARDTKLDKEKMSPGLFVDAVSKNHKKAQWTKSLEETVDLLLKETKRDDLIITMGAGDVYKIGENYLTI